MTPPPTYYASVNPEVLALMPRDARKVLEIGCGAGALAYAYKHMNPAVEYHGVEIMPKPAELARNVIDTVIEGDIGEHTPELLRQHRGAFDCIIYGDVLEHLVDPWAIVRQHKDLLSPSGVMIACIPNIQHWTALYDLLHGRWRYADQGLMDRTHMRFFTSESMQQLFRDAGLTLVDMRGRRIPAYGEQERMPFNQFMEALQPALTSLNIERAAFTQQAATLQYVLRSVPSPAALTPLLVRSLMLKPAAACNDVRVLEPQQWLSTIPGVRTHNEVSNFNTKWSEVSAETPKVFVYQRPILTYDNIALLKWLLRNNYLIIMEFDDHPERWPAIEENRYLNFTGCHGVQTSTQPLSEFFSQYNPNVRIFPNQIASLPPRRTHAPGRTRLFYGALNRSEDISPYLPALNRQLKRFGEAAHIDVVFDRKTFDALETSHKTFTPLCDYATYQQLLAKADINLMPLADTMFNSMKSDLKFIESAAFGAVALASPTVYRHSIRDGETGVLFETTEEFETRLQQLVENASHRQTIVDAAHAYVKSERLLSHHYRKRLDWYQELLTRLPELNAQLKARVPELFS